MDQALPSTSERVKGALTNRNIWGAETPQVVDRLDGASNETFKVLAGNLTCVLRINNELSHLGVNRKLEANILSQIQGLGFAPEVIYNDLSILVTRFVERPALASSDAENIDAVAGALRQLHNRTWTPNQSSIHVLWTPEATLENLGQQCIDLLPDNSPAAALINQNLKPLLERPWPENLEALCHGDLNPGNILMGTNGVVLIDWEYARLANPCFDLASYIESHHLSDAATKTFLQAYGCEIDPAELEAYRLAFRLIDILWWQLRTPQSEQDFLNRLATL